ncbi:MAG: TIGR00282 family metallophosphoesterase [Bacilli bacterium]
MKILFLGDIVGPLGREAVKSFLSQNHFDFVIANGENTTHGHGLSNKHYNELLSYGIDCITSGNHFFNSRDPFHPEFDFSKQVRPYNLDKSCPGLGTNVFLAHNGEKIRVTNLLGRVFTGTMAQSNPFTDLDEICSLDDYPIIHIVDFHAEATAEKRCLAEYAGSKLTAIIGTHTHVQTNDAKILTNGAFFLTDAGMNGAYDSCLGDEKDGPIKRTMTGLPAEMIVPRIGEAMLNGVILEVDTTSKKVISYSLVNKIEASV